MSGSASLKNSGLGHLAEVCETERRKFNTSFNSSPSNGDANSSDEYSDQEDRISRKRSSSPVASTSKRMKLLACDEKRNTVDNGEKENEGMESGEEEEEVMEEEEDEDLIAERTTIPSSSDDERCGYNEEENEETEEKEHRHPIDGPIDAYSRMERFRQLAGVLERRAEMVPHKEPSQLTERCRGIGPADKVWSLLCHKDDVHSISSSSILQPHTHPERPLNPFSRATLIDWILDVCFSEKLHRETFHLCIYYIDRFLQLSPNYNINLSLNQFQLLGTTAMFIASKFEEIYPPRLDDLVSWTDHACDADQVRVMELQVLKVLEWELNVMTPIHWLAFFLQLLAAHDSPSQSTSSAPVAALSCASLAHLPDHVHYVDASEGRTPGVLRGTVVPLHMRHHFISMAKVLDMAILDVECRRFTNRALAAALMYTRFQPQSLVGEATGVSVREAWKAIEWIEPFVIYCEMNEETGEPLPHFENVAKDDVHNIQLQRLGLNIDNADSLKMMMEEVEELRFSRRCGARAEATPTAHSFSSSTSTRGAAIHLRH